MIPSSPDESELLFTNSVATEVQRIVAAHSPAASLIICDSNTVLHCLPVLKLHNIPVIVFQAGEENKNERVLFEVLDQFKSNKAQRSTLILNLGGGVVSDLGGFAASIYLRGLQFVNIPTTLLAMADAAIGGKTGIDFKGLKNMIGSFTLPKKVIIDPVFLQTLPEEETKSAMAEVIKTAWMFDSDLVHTLDSSKLNMDTINRCAALKNEVQVRDFYDAGERQKLNFGHTIGHAYEALMLQKGNPVKHGFAVAAGMLAEAKMAVIHGLLSEELYEKLRFQIYLHTGIEALTQEQFDALKVFLIHDKKNKGEGISFALPSGAGTGKFGYVLSESEIRYPH